MEEQTKSLPHGGDWAGFAAECGVLPLDFSASVSPLGLPGGVRTAAAQALGKADRYPDPLCRALRRAIAAEEGVAEEMVLCGCGAADLIWRAVGAWRPRQALVLAPTFRSMKTRSMRRTARWRTVRCGGKQVLQPGKSCWTP